MNTPGDAVAHILIVEDDQGIREQLKIYLSGRGYWCSTAANAESAGRLMEVLKFDLMIVDVLMPGMDGKTFVRRLRRNSEVPVIMLTALGGLENVLDGFDAGSDDYLSKPFEPAELVARIEALLRRAPPPDDGVEEVSEITFGEHRFDMLRGELWRDGTQIPISEMDAELLKRLAETPNRPVDRSELISGSEDVDEFGQNRAVDVRISRLRQKFESDPKHPRHLITVRGRGYKLMTG